jgi:hypothetical protein
MDTSIPMRKKSELDRLLDEYSKNINGIVSDACEKLDKLKVLEGISLYNAVNEYFDNFPERPIVKFNQKAFDIYVNGMAYPNSSSIYPIDESAFSSWEEAQALSMIRVYGVNY